MKGLRRWAEEGADKLRHAFSEWAAPEVLLQLGVGFKANGLFDETLGDMPLEFLEDSDFGPSATGLPLTFTLGTCGERQVLLLQGHRYLYEGLGMEVCALPVCAAALAGVKHFVLLEVGFSLREDFKPGTWVLLTDYINAMGSSPLAGNLDLCENAFFNVGDVFSQHLNSMIVNAIAGVGLSPRLGVCQAGSGPQLDSPAEVRIAQRNGADVLCNGLLPETLSGAALGAEVSALLLVGEAAPTYAGKRVRYDDLSDAAEFCSDAMMRGLKCAFREGLAHK